MRYFIMGMVLLCLSCNNLDKKTKVAAASHKPKIEYLDRDSVKINGIVPIVSDFKTTVAKLGKQARQIKPNYHNIGPNVNKGQRTGHWFFNAMAFDKSEDTLIFRSVDFRKDTSVYLISSKIKLSYKNTLADYKKLYPISGDNELSGTDMDRYKVVALNGDRKQKQNVWMLYFNADGSKLLWIDYDIPD